MLFVVAFLTNLLHVFEAQILEKPRCLHEHLPQAPPHVFLYFCILYVKLTLKLKSSKSEVFDSEREEEEEDAFIEFFSQCLPENWTFPVPTVAFERLVCLV